MNGGRPSSLTETVLKNLETAMSLGANFTTAAWYAGIHPKTFARWRKRGLEAAMELENGKASHIPVEDLPYVEMLYRVNQGRAKHAVLNLGKIQKKTDRDWRAAAWNLEHLHDGYGKTDNISIDEETAQTIVKVVKGINIDEV